MTMLERYNLGQIQSLGDLFRTLMRRPSVEVPVVLPKALPLTEEQLKSLKRLPDIYGQVLPTERRDLQPTEIDLLFEERKTIDAIQAALEKRKDNIRTTVLNAMDVAFEEEVRAEVEAEFELNPEAFEDTSVEYEVQKKLSDVTRDKDGHYVRKVRRDVPSSDSAFSWEVVEGAPSIDIEALREAGDDDEQPLVTHEDYLAMTSQVRVFDEAKFLQRIKERPELLGVLPKVTIPGNIRGSLYLRKKG